jgi:hypothetical protein
MVLCKGTVVVHRDSVPVYCSEEIAGRPCGDYDLTRHRSIASCRLVYVANGCRRCAGHVYERPRQLVRSGRAA